MDWVDALMGGGRRIETQVHRLSDRVRPYVLALAALAAASLVAAFLLRVAGAKAAIAVSLLGDLVFLGAAWLGYGPGLLTCVLMTYAVPPLLMPGRPLQTDLGRFGLLVFLSLLISWVGASRRRSEASLRRSTEMLQARVAERTDELESSGQRYRLLFESNPHPMWVYDQHTLAFLTVNDTAIRSYGYTREEFLSMTLKDIRPEEDVPKLMEVTATPAAGLNREGPWRHRKKDGQIISVDITEQPLVFGERPACLVMATDITDRLRLEEQFRQAQRMESIGRLAGGVAHDFNNMLTVINGYSEMLLNDASTGNASREALLEIREAGERAAELTRQLLAFSRQQVLQLSVINVNTVVQETETFLRRLIGEDVTLTTRLASDLCLIQGDARQLQQIIMNLAVNSRDAMPNGGTLLIETVNVTLDDEHQNEHHQVKAGEYVMIAVTDTGEGMSPEVQERIFEPFYTTKGLGKGTGLGLATVYGMVKHAGGWIWVCSELKQGTTFKIYFPRTEKGLTSPTPAVKAGLHGSETIVIVEDQAEVRSVAMSGLAHFGYAVHAFETGKEAVAFCREFPGQIHVVVTDVVMPDMNGREVARAIEQIRPESRIVFMSGYTANVIVHQGVLDAGVEYLQKPFTPDSLARKVREVIGRGGSTTA